MPPSVETNYRPVVAAIFAVILAVAGVWSSKRRPWKGGKDGMAAVKTFMNMFMALAFIESPTGVTVAAHSATMRTPES